MTDTTFATDAFFEDIDQPRRDRAIAAARARGMTRVPASTCGCKSKRGKVMLAGGGFLAGLLVARVIL